MPMGVKGSECCGTVSVCAATTGAVGTGVRTTVTVPRVKLVGAEERYALTVRLKEGCMRKSSAEELRTLSWLRRGEARQKKGRRLGRRIV